MSSPRSHFIIKKKLDWLNISLLFSEFETSSIRNKIKQIIFMYNWYSYVFLQLILCTRSHFIIKKKIDGLINLYSLVNLNLCPQGTKSNKLLPCITEYSYVVYSLFYGCWQEHRCWVCLWDRSYKSYEGHQPWFSIWCWRDWLCKFLVWARL